MIFQVFDCLANVEIARRESRKEADELCAIHGGSDACIHVFEIEESKENEAVTKSKKPSAGMLF